MDKNSLVSFIAVLAAAATPVEAGVMNINITGEYNIPNLFSSTGALSINFSTNSSNFAYENYGAFTSRNMPIDLSLGSTTYHESVGGYAGWFNYSDINYKGIDIRMHGLLNPLDSLQMIFVSPTALFNGTSLNPTINQISLTNLWGGIYYYTGNSVGYASGQIQNATYIASSAPNLPSSGVVGKYFIFPLQATDVVPSEKPAYQLITQAGGKSSDGTIDPYHTGGGFYSLDLKANERATVVATASGIVTQVCSTYICQNGTGPVVTIYHGNGYFTEYREFTKNPTVQVGAWVDAGQKIGDFIPGGTNNIINSNGNTALHFQVKYTPNFTASCQDASTCIPKLGDAVAAFGSGLGLSSVSVLQLQSVKLAGQSLTSPTYQLHPDANGITALGPTAQNGPITVLSTPSFSNFNTIDTTINGSVAQLVEHSPAYLWGDITIPADAEYMSFDYLWSKIGDGDYMTVYFGDALLFSSIGLDFTGVDFVNSGIIDIANFAGQTNQLLFWLNSVGDPNAEVDIQKLAFYSSAVTNVPEPASLALVGLGLAGIAAARRKQKH